jgi:hypothetical protein
MIDCESRRGERKERDGQKALHADSFFFCFARFVRATAAARDALRAISLRCSDVMVFSRAFPPLLPISARYLDTADASMGARYHQSGLEAREK